MKTEEDDTIYSDIIERTVYNETKKQEDKIEKKIIGGLHEERLDGDFMLISDDKIIDFSK